MMHLDRMCAKVQDMRSRAVSAVALLLLVLGQLGAMSHAAAVRHVRCVAHDELVEAAVVEAHSTDATRLVGVRTGEGDDVHCELAAALHHDVARPHAHVGQLVLVAAHAAPFVPVSPVAVAAVYAFAPKTSPPDRWVSIT